MIEFALFDPKATGRDAAEAFARTYPGGRKVEFIGADLFRFVDGVRLYRVEWTKIGWKVSIASV